MLGIRDGQMMEGRGGDGADGCCQGEWSQWSGLNKWVLGKELRGKKLDWRGVVQQVFNDVCLFLLLMS